MMHDYNKNSMLNEILSMQKNMRCQQGKLGQNPAYKEETSDNVDSKEDYPLNCGVWDVACFTTLTD